MSDVTSERVNHVNIYDELDPVQSHGGNSWMNKVFGLYSKGGRLGMRLGQQMGLGELGEAGIRFNNVRNISVDKPQSSFGDFHNSHNRIQDWIGKTIEK